MTLIFTSTVVRREKKYELEWKKGGGVFIAVTIRALEKQASVTSVTESHVWQY